jgi:type I site-specific restriction endonuclease
MPLFCEFSSLCTESDVEQKLIFPFLTTLEPMGLGIDSSQIMTKAVLRQRCIGKGQKQKYYFPDYVVVIRGIPVLVLEAKKPDEDLGDAYAEARLYAEENQNLRRQFLDWGGKESSK